MALPGLVRVTTLARLLTLGREATLDWVRRSGGHPVRRPRADSQAGTGPWYCTVDDALAALDLALPKVVHRRANRRAREGLARDAALVATSGPCVRYRDC
jgi:hypothetical protein